MKLSENLRLFGVMPISFVFFAHSLLCLLAGTEEGSAVVNAVLIIMGLFYAALGIGLIRESPLFRRIALFYCGISVVLSALIGAFLVYAGATHHPFTETWSVEACGQFFTGNFAFNLIALIFFCFVKFEK